MASGGYYYSPYHYQPAPNYYNYSPQQRASSVPGLLLLATVTLLAASASLIAWCGSAVESLIHQLRGFLILSPVLVVVAVQLWVSSGEGDVSLLGGLVAVGQREQYYYQYRYRGGGGSAGSSPWGVALALVLVLFLVSYQSSIHQRWFWPVTAAVFTLIGVIHGTIRFRRTDEYLVSA